MAHAVRSSDVSGRLAGFATSESLGTVVPTELRLSTELDAFRLRPLPSFISSGSDQMTFEGRQPSQDRNHQLAMGEW